MADKITVDLVGQLVVTKNGKVNKHKGRVELDSTEAKRLLRIGRAKEVSNKSAKKVDIPAAKEKAKGGDSSA